MEKGTMFKVFPYHNIPDGSLLASLIWSETDIRACHQCASREVPLSANTCKTNRWKTRHKSGQSIYDWEGRNLVSQRFHLVNLSQIAFGQSHSFCDQISWNCALLQYVMLFSYLNLIRSKILLKQVSAFRWPPTPYKTYKTRQLLNKYWVKEWQSIWL